LSRYLVTGAAGSVGARPCEEGFAALVRWDRENREWAREIDTE